MKKLISLIFVFVLILNFVLYVFGKLDTLDFWIVILVAFIFSAHTTVEERENFLLLCLGRSFEEEDFVEYVHSVPELHGAYTSLIGKGYLKVIASRLSGDVSVDNVAFTEKGVDEYSRLASSLLYMNNFLDSM